MATANKVRGRPRLDPPLQRVLCLSLKGSPEYREWMRRASEKTGVIYSRMFRDALMLWAIKHGLPEPPRK